MHDLLIRNVALPDGRTRQDVLIGGGRIVAVASALEAAAEQTIDGGGQLL